MMCVHALTHTHTPSSAHTPCTHTCMHAHTNRIHDVHVHTFMVLCMCFIEELQERTQEGKREETCQSGCTNVQEKEERCMYIYPFPVCVFG